MKTILTKRLFTLFILAAVPLVLFSAEEQAITSYVNLDEIKSGDINAVRSLISSRVNINVKVSIEGKSDTSLLSHAVENNKLEIVALLIENNADPDIREKPNNIVPLMTAVLGGSLEMASLLIEHKANVNLKTLNGNSSFSFALRTVNRKMIKLLELKGADSEDAIKKFKAQEDFVKSKEGSFYLEDISEKDIYGGR